MTRALPRTVVLLAACLAVAGALLHPAPRIATRHFARRVATVTMARAPVDRRAAAGQLAALGIGAIATTARPGGAVAANIPTDNGAGGRARGTAEALRDVVAMQAAVEAAVAACPKNLGEVQKSLGSKAVPTSEKDFKRLFDEYSEAITYKQRYMDQNAFLVYYTGGFDGPGRPKMEENRDEYVASTANASTSVGRYHHRSPANLMIPQRTAHQGTPGRISNMAFGTRLGSAWTTREPRSRTF